MNTGDAVTVQFVIERECPHPGDFPTSITVYPECIFVEWPPVDSKEIMLPCGSSHYYRIPDEEAKRIGYDPDSHDWHVCRHMGHIIE